MSQRKLNRDLDRAALGSLGAAAEASDGDAGGAGAGGGGARHEADATAVAAAAAPQRRRPARVEPRGPTVDAPARRADAADPRDPDADAAQRRGRELADFGTRVIAYVVPLGGEVHAEGAAEVAGEVVGEAREPRRIAAAEGGVDGARFPVEHQLEHQPVSAVA